MAKIENLPFGPLLTKRVKLKGDHFSVSQAGTFNICKRKWAFEKFYGWKSGSKAADNGKACHEELEEYLLTGTVDEDFLFYPSVYNLLPLIPKPMQRGLQVEREIRFSIGDINVLGACDWTLEKGDYIIVGDHKFTGNFAYAKDTKEKLISDPQGAMYAYYFFTLGYNHVELCWNYTKFKEFSPRWRKVPSLTNHFEVAYEEILPTVKATYKTMKKMKKLRESKLLPMEIEGNWEGCDAFGGCAFKDYCQERPRTTSDLMRLFR